MEGYILKNVIVNLVLGVLVCFFVITGTPYLLEIKDNVKENITSTFLKESSTSQEENLLRIPSLQFEKPFYAIDHKKNNLKYGLYVLKESIFPEEENTSEVFIASHSGNGAYSYFKDLHKLKVGDMVELVYQNKNYVYEIVSIEYQKKQGFLYIDKKDFSALYLITCTKDTKDQQTIIVAKMQ